MVSSSVRPSTNKVNDTKWTMFAALCEKRKICASMASTPLTPVYSPLSEVTVVVILLSKNDVPAWDSAVVTIYLSNSPFEPI